MNFNSIKVRLKPQSAHLIVKLMFYFNSIKVRLKQQASSEKTDEKKFQFHKGTIKTIE